MKKLKKKKLVKITLMKILIIKKIKLINYVAGPQQIFYLPHIQKVFCDVFLAKFL